ncbi:MAG: type III polyketide synthase [Phycisphaerales bacterium]|nr:type III polyketide synthase [Phycisphaerales bacterium]
MTAAIAGIGLATPPNRIAQAGALRAAVQSSGLGAGAARTLEALYRRAGVECRATVLTPAEGFFPTALGPDDLGPGTRTRMERYELHAAALARGACRSALDAASIRPGAVTHLVTASCTGFHAPGVDLELMGALGLPAGIARTHIGFMGCHAAVNALRVAHAYVRADPAAVVLVGTVELCSLHFHYGAEPGAVVANALFADGSAAAVLTGLGRASAPLLRATGSVVIPDSADAMTWSVGDHGFVMTLSAAVPGLVQTHLRGWLEPWLSRHGLGIDSVTAWAIHPGGPRVLSAVAESLGLPGRVTAASRAVLAEHGNMSSATLLFILSRLLREGARGPCVALAFGPGLAVEAALLDLPG